MSGGGGDQPPLPAVNGGEFILSLLQKHNRHHPQSPQPPLRTGPTPITQQHQPPQQQSLVLDPAVAAVGPTIGFPPSPWSSNGRDLPSTTTHPPWLQPLSPPFPSDFLGFPQYPVNQLPPNQFPANQRLLAEDLHKLGLAGNTNYAINNLVQQKSQQQEQQKLLFGSLPNNSVQISKGLLNGNLLDNFNSTKDRELKNRPSVHSNSNSSPSSLQHRNFDSREQEQRGRGGWGKQHGNHSGNFKSTPPPGFSNKHGGGGRGGNWDFGSNNSNRRRGFDHNVDKEKGDHSELSNRSVHLNGENGRFRRSSMEYGDVVGLTGQLDHPGPPAGSSLHSVSASDIEESLLDFHSEVLEEGDGEKYGREAKTRREGGSDGGIGGREMDDFGKELVESLLLEEEADEKDDKKQHRNSREKESRKDNRGQRLLSQRIRNLKRHMVCRGDIDRLNVPFLAIFESLSPAEEEKAKQKQLLTLLEKLVSKEWPEARLYLYGSCANSFGVSKSDIDVCLAINDADINKSEILLKLADILQSDNLQNVQALTRARVPIVKLMDPVTGISCDICINNVLAVVNTKLLRDYARIDARLQQLAFIVKHWAKSRGVNETYHGTLSSYAYVLMCIHFLQQRKPAILPCLQGMGTTYSVTVDDINCAYFDQVEKLRNFGSHNKETVAQLVWGFFNYWAYRHDYANAVISVRTGSIISKQEKDWTRRIGNDRHLICIEDPFEISHDLGRVVDKYSIKVLREEFERAAYIMQDDPNPCATLFEPYVPS